MKYAVRLAVLLCSCRRSRKGAWIEIPLLRIKLKLSIVAPARERGLKSERLLFEHFQAMVAPARERGLKYSTPRKMKVQSGRSRKGAWIEIGKITL